MWGSHDGDIEHCFLRDVTPCSPVEINWNFQFMSSSALTTTFTCISAGTQYITFILFRSPYFGLLWKKDNLGIWSFSFAQWRGRGLRCCGLLRWVDVSVSADVSNKVAALIFEVWKFVEEGTHVVGLLNAWRWRRSVVPEPEESPTLLLSVTTQQQTWIFTGWYQGYMKLGSGCAEIHFSGFALAVTLFLTAVSCFKDVR
jgi:hypothetical protein